MNLRQEPTRTDNMQPLSLPPPILVSELMKLSFIKFCRLIKDKNYFFYSWNGNWWPYYILGHARMMIIPRWLKHEVTTCMKITFTAAYHTVSSPRLPKEAIRTVSCKSPSCESLKILNYGNACMISQACRTLLKVKVGAVQQEPVQDFECLWPLIWCSELAPSLASSYCGHRNCGTNYMAQCCFARRWTGAGKVGAHYWLLMPHPIWEWPCSASANERCLTGRLTLCVN